MIEAIATIMGLIQGILVWANKRSNWIFYCLQYVFLLIFNIQAKLYGDITNSIIYFFIGVSGFILWNRKKGNVPIKRCSIIEKTAYISIIIISTVIVYFILKGTDDPLPLMGALTTTTGYVATYYMLIKKTDTWILWFINDILYIIEYYMLSERAWYLITLNIIWTFMAIGSYITWNKLSKEQK
ncbi:MAG: nicotinamide mononucleotide transporter [Clostridia bacterium]|nr:nicotinamide mononucleotide transporter [Clostridia bacterium]